MSSDEYLCIVESPGKIAKIQGYLGKNYIVAASVGHIIDLDESSMSINLETFEPEYKIYDNKKEVVNKLKKLTIKVGKENVLLAADEDREGEMIAWSLQKELKLTKPKRIVFNSITEKELKHAVANPKLIDLNLVKAQQARRILDRLAGYLISPVLKKAGLYAASSAGRVQSVVVKIIVDKEREINEFYSQKKSTFFVISVDTKVGDFEITTKLSNKNTNVELELADGVDNPEADNPDTDDSDNNETKNGKKKKATKAKTNTKNTVSTRSYVTFDKSEEDKVVKILKAMVKGKYSLMNKIEKVRKTNAPPPFTTSTLQQCASQRFGMDAKRTMSVAQKLYEAGHITYMRTDSTSISDEAKKLIKDVIEAEFGLQHYEKHDFINKKANTQEAHECVRPTKPQYDQIDGTPDEKKLYNMIWKRTIQSQMKGAEYQSILIEIEIKDKKKILENYKLVGTLENLIYAGFLIVDGKKESKPLDSSKISDVDWIEINAVEDTHKPPTRYNDASLINKMDPKNLNIGRPSTYASFIEKIQTRKYVEIKNIEGKKLEVSKYNAKKSDPSEINVETKEIVIGKEQKKLVPTELGIKVTEFLEKNFEMLMDYKFTANMEKELDDVAEGELNNVKVIEKFYEYITGCLAKIVPIQVQNKLPGTGFDPIILGKFNQDDIKLLNGKHGKYIQCGTFNFNFARLLGEINMSEDNCQKDKEKKLLCDTIINKINNPEQPAKPLKEWKINKMNYVLKDGKFGLYIEEQNQAGVKKGNYSIKYLIDKKASDSNIDISDEDDLNKVIGLITNDDIKNTVEYFKNNNKTKTAYKKK